MTRLGTFELVQYDDKSFIYQFETYRDGRIYTYLILFEIVFPDFNFGLFGIGSIQDKQGYFNIYTSWKEKILLKIEKIELLEIK